MGVILDLRLVDHELVVENGTQSINEALSENDSAVLVDFITAIPFTPNPEAIECRQNRCDRLRSLNAPAVIIENEERVLRLVTGEAYSREALSSKSLDELRELLGQWGWAESSYRLDKAWSALDWFLQPADGPDEFPTTPIRPSVGDPSQTPFDRALKGGQHSPLDQTGQPVIRTCGSEQDGCFGYNPPETIAEIYDALQSVDTDSWSRLTARRVEQYRRGMAEFDPDGILAEGVALDELENAQKAYPVLLKAYSTALERGHGIACEYSL